MKLNKNLAIDILDGDTEDYSIISDDITSNGRWSIHHKLIVSHVPTGKFFKAYYSVGATEYQNEEPWEYEEEVEFLEVIPVEKTVIVYKEIEN